MCAFDSVIILARIVRFEKRDARATMAIMASTNRIYELCMTSMIANE